MHRLLERQFKRALGVSPEQWARLGERLRALAGRLAGEDAELARCLHGLPTLIDRVSEAYGEQERDVDLTRRSLELSSKELYGLNQKLRDEAQATSQALAALQRAFDALTRDDEKGRRSDDLVPMAEQVAALTRDRQRISQALAKSEERFELAMRGANDGVWDYDLVHDSVYYSPGWKAMLGHAEADIGASPREWSDRLHPDDLAPTLQALDDYLAGATDKYEVAFRFRRRDGHYLWILSRGFAVRDAAGRALRIVGTHTDITARKQAEAALIQAKEAAEAASRLKSEFLANMSHEIRTPMNGVLGMLTLALDTPLDHEQREYLELARSSADSLLHIVNDILDFSKIEAGRLDVHPEPVALDALVGELARLFEPRCREAGLACAWRVDPGVPARLLLDPVRLRQVLVNLIGNAIKFTPAGAITLTVAAPDGQLRIAVADTGIGIPADKQAAIFGAFTQADGSITRRFGGTGLGLAICHRLVGLMGGRMGLASEPGRGSEFHCLLPLAEPPAEAGPARALSILLAEDNPINQKLALALLTRAGHRVEVAADGAAALAALEKGGWDLLVIDPQLPGLAGPAAIRARAGDLPTVALCARATPEARAACRAAGMDGYVAKPIRREELLAAIKAAVNRE